MAADLALRQLDEQRRDWLGDALQVLQRQERIWRSHWAADQAVQPLHRVVLMQEQMAGRVGDDSSPAEPIGMHPERGLLRHRAGGHED